MISHSTFPIDRCCNLLIKLAMIVLLLCPITSHGFLFLPPSSSTIATISWSRKSSCCTALGMAKKKGFGNTSPPSQKSKKKKPSPMTAPQTPITDDENTSQIITSSNDLNFNEFAAVDNGKQIESQSKPVEDISRGKLALERMRRKKAEERNVELQKMKQVQDVDQLVRETGGGAAVIPEKVAQRMGKRMLPFVGIPLLGGMGSFVGFWYMAAYRDMEFQPVLVAGTTIALLTIGLVGITYSMMSASWDPEREGSVLGTDEFSRNIENIKNGLTRSQVNAEVREQIMLEENLKQNRIQGTISSSSMSSSSNKNKKAAQSLAEKLGDGMD